VLAAAILLVPVRSWAQPGTTSGEFIVEPATLVSLGVEWKIAGDDNRNARVDVSYRRVGEQAWRNALPLLRLHHEQVNGGADLYVSVERTASNPHGVAPNAWHYDTGNMFAGSILNLEPDTEYQCRFVLSDADGVSGAAEKTATVRTRREPMPAAGGHTYHVYPIGWEGPRLQPAFTGLGNAYFMGQRHSDHQNVFPPRVQAGDVMLVHAGLYIADRFHYMYGVPHPGFLALNTPIDGTYYLTASGTPDKPIAIKAARDGEVIFDGAGSTSDYNGYRLNARSAYAFAWNSPPLDVAADYDYRKKLTVRHFKTLDEFNKTTGQEAHSVVVDYDIFVNVAMPDESDPQRLYNPEDYDFRLKPGSAAIDRSVLLPTNNDDFTGRAPDLGAIELGRPVPHYGPRSDVPGAVPSGQYGAPIVVGTFAAAWRRQMNDRLTSTGIRPMQEAA
jgi:hypothetical protein